MSLTAHRILQYIALILIFTAMAGGYWYWKSQAAVRINQGLEDSLEQGLVGYWKLDDASGTTATDSSGNGNNGTLTNGPTWSTGQVGGGVTFDGTDDAISILDANALDGATFTVSLWTRSSATGSHQWSRLISKKNVYNSSDGWEITMVASAAAPQDDTHLYFSGSSGSNVQLPCVTSWSAGAWHHVVAVYSGSSVTVYCDGLLKGSGTIAPIIANAFPLAIGDNAAFNEGKWQGGVDEARIYNRSLSDEEVKKLYQTTAPTGIDTGLVGYWPMDGDDISGTTASDRSGKGNHGTLVNSPAKVAGKSGQSLNFDGTDDYVDITNTAFNGQFSFSTWFYTANNSQTGIIFGEGTGGGGSASPKIGIVTGNFFVRIVDLGSSDATVAVPTSNQWHHLVVTRDSADKIDLYVDGGGANRLFGNVAQPGTYTLDKLGINGQYVDQQFSGRLDEVRVYNRALTAAEVQDLYQKTQSDTVGASNKRDSLALGLAGYWKLDDASGTTATDSSTNGNNGTLTNGPTWTTGQINGAVGFDGSNDYVSLGAHTTEQTK